MNELLSVPHPHAWWFIGPRRVGVGAGVGRPTTNLDWTPRVFTVVSSLTEVCSAQLLNGPTQVTRLSPSQLSYTNCSHGPLVCKRVKVPGRSPTKPWCIFSKNPQKQKSYLTLPLHPSVRVSHNQHTPHVICTTYREGLVCLLPVRWVDK